MKRRSPAPQFWAFCTGVTAAIFGTGHFAHIGYWWMVPLLAVSGVATLALWVQDAGRVRAENRRAIEVQRRV